MTIVQRWRADFGEEMAVRLAQDRSWLVRRLFYHRQLSGSVPRYKHLETFSFITKGVRHDIISGNAVGLIDEDLDECAQAIQNRVFSQFRDLSWTAAQRALMRPLIRSELDALVQSILGQFDNVGCTKDEGIPDWRICELPSGVEIRVDA